MTDNTNKQKNYFQWIVSIFHLLIMSPNIFKNLHKEVTKLHTNIDPFSSCNFVNPLWLFVILLLLKTVPYSQVI